MSEVYFINSRQEINSDAFLPVVTTCRGPSMPRRANCPDEDDELEDGYDYDSDADRAYMPESENDDMEDEFEDEEEEEV